MPLKHSISRYQSDLNIFGNLYRYLKHYFLTLSLLINKHDSGYILQIHTLLQYTDKPRLKHFAKIDKPVEAVHVLFLESMCEQDVKLGHHKNKNIIWQKG